MNFRDLVGAAVGALAMLGVMQMANPAPPATSQEMVKAFGPSDPALVCDMLDYVKGLDR
jgi:hypothetical protein